MTDQIQRDPIPILPVDWDNTPKNDMMRVTYSKFNYAEVSSACQKAVRRGYKEEAIQWILEMFLVGDKAKTNAWNRLLTFCVEDISIADPACLSKIHYLWTNHYNDELAIATAVSITAETKKCRASDWTTRIWPEMRIPKLADVEVGKIGSVEKTYELFKETLDERDYGYALFYSKILTYTTKKMVVKIERTNSPLMFIWKAFDEIIIKRKMNNGYSNMCKSIARSKNWWMNDRSRLIINHMILLICFDIYSSNHSEIKINPDPELIDVVNRVKRRQSLLGIPDYAKDKHTRSGKDRGIDHFMEHGSYLNNRDDRFVEFDDDLKKIFMNLYNEEERLLKLHNSEDKIDMNKIPEVKKNDINDENNDQGIDKSWYKGETVVKMKRIKGTVVQGCTLYIGRACNMGGWRLKKSKWHNPFKVKKDGTLEEVLQKYRKYIKNSDLINHLHELKNQTLGCWCDTKQCHGYILLELLNNN